MSRAHYLAVWEFLVKRDSIPTFEKLYGPEGAWARLFRESPDYCGTELLRDPNQPGRYLTLDCWTSSAAVQAFKRDHHAAYAALDQESEASTEQETFLGEFETIDAEPQSPSPKP
jgi:heme-degrading monooxygenase HmoA